jgi:hypothetical protein
VKRVMRPSAWDHHGSAVSKRRAPAALAHAGLQLHRVALMQLPGGPSSWMADEEPRAVPAAPAPRQRRARFPTDAPCKQEMQPVSLSLAQLPGQLVDGVKGQRQLLYGAVVLDEMRGAE